MKHLLFLLPALALVGAAHATEKSAELERGFLSPPAAARPWVYWFWLNGNITKHGITADLEAMQRVGIGGVLIMEVDQGAPVGPVDFMGPAWRDNFKLVVKEAHRLGLEVNMNNDAGWNGSGGPWIRPEQSMQKVVWSETNFTGPTHFEGTLPQPETIAAFYRDISVLAFRATGPYRIANVRSKAAYQLGPVGASAPTNLPSEMVIARKAVTDISLKMDSNGRFVWDVPEGRWTVMRFGHTSTGKENAPAPKTGRGLECDKLSTEGIAANFNGMMAKLIADNGNKRGLVRPGLVATHIDSWENGSQNWTGRMREEFWQRRGYDLGPFLPVMSGRVVESLEVSERFLWDLRQTVSELVIEDYAGRMRQLAHEHGLRFTVEAYGGPCDDLPYGGRSDEPMGEFWSPSGAIKTCKGMASAAHVYGKRIVGAEAFTAGDHERWREYPATIKALGDRAFCEGINRFVIHRYALQPWSVERRPGMTMGPWGQHYERTETWWDQTVPWHQYLARCQYLLRQGLCVADICYLQAEAPPQGFNDHPRQGYNWDECPAEVLMKRMSVSKGRLVLPDGMNYRVLVLPPTATMTPALLRRVKELADAGATVIGAPPQKSPSLNHYPECDGEVKQLAAELWADCDGVRIKERRFGQGRIVRGVEPEKVLRDSGLPPDFSSGESLRYIHRATKSGEIYFVANSSARSVTTTAAFRVNGKLPELWWPDSGRMEPAAMYWETNGLTRVALRLGPSGSVFVVFRRERGHDDPFVSVTQDGEPVLTAAPAAAVRVVIDRATYGVPGDPQRSRDVRAKVQRFLDGGRSSFQVSEMAAGDDPAYGVVKTLVVECAVDGKHVTLTGTDPETMDFSAAAPSSEHVVELRRSPDGQTLFEAWRPAAYELHTASGRTLRCEVAALPAPLEVTGPWKVRFAPGWGAPAEITFPRLISWSDHTEPGVKHFSGAATYSKTFSLPRAMVGKNQRLYLDLGDVQVLAQVKLNGRDLGLAWKPPFQMDITEVARAGNNRLEIKVINLWPNRMIGDEQLPEDSERNPNGTLKCWPPWLDEGKPSPTGRYTFTTWRLWKKGDPLLRSGLLGPVRLQSAAVKVLR